MREYALVFLTALAVTYLLAVPARELAMRAGAVARVRDRDVHEIPIPYFGGVAMMGGLLAALLVAGQLPFLGHSPLHDVIFSDARAVLIGGAVMCLVGVADDIFELDAITKFAGEVLGAGVVVVQGVQFTWLPFPYGGHTLSMFTLDPSQAALISILVIVATVNAVNFVDGLDGLAAGVIGIGAFAFFSFSVALVLINNTELATTAAMLSAALAGACFGFLPHNFFPARMFMGDSGSLLIGFMLACSAISLTGQFTTTTINQGSGGLLPALPALLPLILPFAVLLVPFADLLLAVVRRTRAGRSPFAADKKHLHHRLLEIGHSQRRAVLVMYLWAALVAFGVVVVSLFSGWWSALGLSLMAVTALLLTFGVPGHSGLIKADQA